MTVCRLPGWYSGITTSSNSAALCFSASHARSDHDA